MTYPIKLIEDTIIERVMKYEVSSVDNEFYLYVTSSIDKTKYSTTRYFSKENGKVYMTVTIKTIKVGRVI